MLIIAILSTIWLVVFQWYSRDTRDAARMSDLEKIREWLELYSLNESKVPFPEDSVLITAGGKTIQSQWTITDLNLSLIWFQGSWTDPKDDTYYVYTSDEKDFQLMWLLEQETLESSIWERYPFFKWKKMGIFVDDTTDKPVNEIWDDIDIIVTSWVYKVFDSMNSDYFFTGSWETLWRKLSYRINGTANCAEILAKWVTNSDWTYTTAIRDDLPVSEVYCDMTTDGGWWTAVVMLADSTTANMFKTGTAWLVPSVTENIATVWSLDYFWVDDDEKDILIRGWSSDPLIHNVYNTWSVIYNYMKRDIENLTRFEKQTGGWSNDVTMFSSIPLKIKYLNNNQEFNTEVRWWDSLSSNNSHYIMVQPNWYFLDLFGWNGFNSRNHNAWETEPGTPSDAYRTSGVDTSLDHLFNSQNYMVVFLK